MKLNFKLIKNRNTVFFIITALIMIIMVWYGATGSIEYTPNLNYDPNVEYAPGRVVEVVADATAINDYGIRTGWQQLRVEILRGRNKGEIIEITHRLYMENSVHAKVGNRLNIYLYQPPERDTPVAVAQSYERALPVYAIIGLFILLLALIGGKIGMRSAFGLIFTFIVIIFLLIPLIVKGYPPAWLTLGLGFVIIAVSLISILGFTKKTLVCILSTGIGAVICCLFYLVFTRMLHITGYNIDEIGALLVVMRDSNIQIGDFLFCGILIASWGAIMDVTVSITSCIEELSDTNPDSNFKALYRSGMKIGRDVVGSMSNTLILAFAGTFFISLVMFRINKIDYGRLINSTDIAIEILRAVAVSSSLILVAPITAFIASKMYGDK